MLFALQKGQYEKLPVSAHDALVPLEGLAVWPLQCQHLN